MAALNPRLADLSDDDRQVLESWLVEFDQGWDEGLLANRLDQIPPGSSWRLPALAEMVKIDLQRQWERGRQVSLESYLEEFPELGSPGDVSADLIRVEYEVRRQFGAPLPLEDYLHRFPHQAEELARLIAHSGSALSHRSSAAAPSPSRISSPVQRSAKSPEPLPEQFGRYRIIKRLGQGGMGSVYLAQDTHLERPVALKVPDFGNHEDPDARRRFLEEARTAATLRHPYLCPVYDAGEIDGQPYLTMAYIQGQSLAALIGAEGWPQRQVAALVGKLALALQEAHTKKVVHRDLKPANVMIKTTGQRREPVIVDFGLARRENPQEQRLTKSGQVMGTLGYMAPEQIRGDLKEIGPGCDIYALGVILYELLTGRLPFSGSGLAVAGQILTQAPLPPSAHRSDLDPALEAICLKAMAKAIGDRYTSMAELAAALTGFLQSPSASSAAAATAGSPVAPSQASGERPQPPGNNSLVGKFLAQLAGTEASASPVPTPEPVASAVPLSERRRPVWPIIVGASVLGVVLLAVIVAMVAHTGPLKNTAGDASVLSNGADERSARAQLDQPSIPDMYTDKGSINNEVNDPKGAGGKEPFRPDPTAHGTGGLPTNLAQPLVGETPKIDPSRYIDIQLITSCSGPLGEIFGGTWWSIAGPKSTIRPTVPISSGGYLGTAAHVTGTRAFGEYATLGINIFGHTPFDASRYHGISFYAKADKPMEIQVEMGQKNTEPAYGYNRPKLALTVGTVWNRFVVPFDALVSDPVPGGGRVPLTLASIDFFAFAMPVGAFDFWVDEIYFVRSNDTGGAGSGGGSVGSGTRDGNVDPSRYIDIQLISSCSDPVGEIFGGTWWSVAGPKSTIKPLVPPGDFSMSSGGYHGTAAHVTGARALGAVENAKLGINLHRGGTPLFDASRYHGISFYAKADKPMEVQVGLGQKNSVSYHYNNPKRAVTVGTTWSRYIVPFDGLLSDPLPGGGRVPVTLATIDFLEFLMPVGAFDFWVDEIYFVRGNDTGGAVGGSGGTRGGNVDPSRYVDIQLIASCSGPRGECLDGAWWSAAGPKSTIKPPFRPGDPFSMTSGGYLGTAAHVTGTRAGAIEEYVNLGINMRRGGQGFFDASRYQGISFYAKADKPMEIEVRMGQENTLANGTNCPKTAVTISTAWSRYVVPFDALVSDSVPGAGQVPVTPATITQFVFIMPPGAFDFWVDEIYFVRGVEKVQGTVLGSTVSTERKPPGPTSVAAAGSPATKLADKPRMSRSADSRGQAGSTGPPNQITNSIGIKLVLIPADTFLMGSPEEDKGVRGDEKPQHPVRITRPFYLGVTEVTRGQFRRFVAEDGYHSEAEKDGKGGEGWNEERNRFEMSPRYFWQNPGFDQTDEHPVVNVSWNDAVAFAHWLSRTEKKSYRLPTEAEWEYACRAGTTTRFWYGDNQDGLAAVANVKDGTAKEKHPDWVTSLAARDGYVYTAPVGQFRANAFGLYDMHGNAEEWCSDGYAPDYYRQSPVDDPPGASGTSDQVLRGGGWYNVPANNRSAGRWRAPPNTRTNWRGFRLALVPSGP